MPNQNYKSRGRSTSPHRGGVATPSRSQSRGPGNDRARSRSRGPGDAPRSRSKSASRPGRSMSPSGGGGGGAKRGKRTAEQQQKFKGKKVPKSVRKSVKKVGKVSKKGVRKVKKYGSKPVKKFQQTNIGKRIAPRESCGTAKVCSYLFAIILLFASAIGLVIATGNAEALEDIVNAVVPELDLGNLADPFKGGGTVGVWPVAEPKAGLSIEILNALDDSWQTVFQLAFADWQFGQPDALQISTSNVAVDADCNPVSGKIKVCNGDYGAQPWRGLAVCIVGSDGFYQNCSCKMNDYYLKNAIADLRQYTMCHEMGHGFGLPHTDEDFTNADLGNCLDYTENYSVNKSPDESNYQKLAEFYGVLSSRRQQRSLRSGGLQSASTEEELDSMKIPEAVLQRRQEVLEELETGAYTNFHAGHGWRMLHQTNHGEEHMIDIGDGYRLQVQLLLHTS